MQAQYYGNSILVTGDTKTWKENIKQLGGSWNSKLKGWVFKRELEQPLMQFIANAEAGLVQPIPAQPYQPTQPVQPATMVPQGYAQPALTPQAAMARLTVGQPIASPVPFPQVTMSAVPFPQAATPGVLPTIAPIVGQAASPTITKPLTLTGPKPVTPLPPQHQVLNFPNLFTAADGLQYQVIIYTAPLPSMGQKVTLSVGGTSIEYAVSGIEKISPPFDSIFITQTGVDQDPPLSRAILMGGEWKIPCMEEEHKLTFHPLV